MCRVCLMDEHGGALGRVGRGAAPSTRTVYGRLGWIEDGIEQGLLCRTDSRVLPDWLPFLPFCHYLLRLHPHLNRIRSTVPNQHCIIRDVGGSTATSTS